MTAATTPLLEVLRISFRKLMNDHSDHIIGGACKDYPSYTHATGVIEGLALAERELLDLDKQQHADDDD